MTLGTCSLRASLWLSQCCTPWWVKGEDGAGYVWHGNGQPNCLLNRCYVCGVAGLIMVQVADFLWVWVSWLCTDKQSTAGLCVDSYQRTQILAAYLLAFAVCFMFASISFWCTEKAEQATSQEKQLVWDLVASSFSYAIGMSFYNAMSFSLTCMPNDLYVQLKDDTVQRCGG